MRVQFQAERGRSRLTHGGGMRIVDLTAITAPDRVPQAKHMGECC
ncbi:hypothetical protein [Paracoccus fistulariae]|nr:hypothetical protein [Paracoccus fistulariae]MDB6180547.1 hypothetical protein [Paracoccus fistulariae]